MIDHAQPGLVVGGRCRLDEVVGAGGFGRVWRAFDLVLHVKVAVKEVRLPPSASRAEHAKRLADAEREARAAAQVRGHPHIVDVLDVVIAGDAPWIVMQYVLGPTLARVVDSDGPLPVERVVGLAAGLLDALAAAHAAGIAHRDVKPHDVMLEESGRAVLTDFGIASWSSEGSVSTARALMGMLEHAARALQRRRGRRVRRHVLARHHSLPGRRRLLAVPPPHPPPRR